MYCRGDDSQGEGLRKAQSIPPTPTVPEWYMHTHAYNSTNTKKQGSRRRLSKEEIVFCIPRHGIGQAFFLPMPSLCIYLIGWRSRPMSPLFGQMTTESFDANAAISLGDLYLIIGPRAPESAPRLITPLDVTPPDSGVFF